MRRPPLARRAGGLLALAVCCTASAARAQHARDVILATTTSVQDSGLLDSLLPRFETACGCQLKTIAVGSGQSLALGARGEADVVLAHAPSLELEYVAQGKLVDRRLVMTNDFVLVGPPADPAHVRGARSAAEALQRIARARGPFASRADSSGTHLLERRLWREAGVAPSGPWYLEVGQGMGATLRVASQKRAYTLTDRGTYLAQRGTLELAVLFESTPELLNLYHVMVPNPDAVPRINRQGGAAFAGFLMAPGTQALIGRYGVSRLGQALFRPAAGRREEDLGRAGR
jgi:tungstate transport system substrate-binding protein